MSRPTQSTPAGRVDGSVTAQRGRPRRPGAPAGGTPRLALKLFIHADAYASGAALPARRSRLARRGTAFVTGVATSTHRTRAARCSVRQTRGVTCKRAQQCGAGAQCAARAGRAARARVGAPRITRYQTPPQPSLQRPWPPGWSCSRRLQGRRPACCARWFSALRRGGSAGRERRGRTFVAALAQLARGGTQRLLILV